MCTASYLNLMAVAMKALVARARRHPELYTEVSDRPCLADHCHVLHCDHAHGDPDDGRVFSWLPSATCNRLDMEASPQPHAGTMHRWRRG